MAAVYRRFTRLGDTDRANASAAESGRGFVSTGSAPPPAGDDDGFVPDLTPALAAAPNGRTVAPGAQAQTVLTAIGETLYEWDLETDRLRWAANAAQVLGLSSTELVASGRDFNALVHPDSLTDRHQAVLNALGVDYGAGVPYEVTYVLRLPEGEGSRNVWVQDRGLWYADAKGEAYLARGALRRVLEPPAGLSLSQKPRELPRRAEFLKLLREVLEVARHYGTTFVFALVSTDNLQMAAEAYGPAATEEMEAALSERVRGAVRRGDIVGWLSDTELGLLLKVADAEEARLAVDRIVRTIGQDIMLLSGGPIAPLTSTGALLVPAGGATVQDCISHARHARRLARGRGPGQFVFHAGTGGGAAAPHHDADIAALLATALNQGNLSLARQPVVRAADGAIAFYECLVRLGGEESSPAPIGEIVAVAEALGVMRFIDLRVQELIFDLLAAEDETILSFNLSVETIQDSAWLESFESRLDGHPEWAGRLIVEITETALIRSVEPVRAFVKRLRDLGCRVALDDFGAGYTSFRNLKLLPVDIVKIDGSFIRDLGRRPEDRIFVETLIGLARHFDLETVAEMVEDPEAADHLTALGVDYLQGFHIGRPERYQPPEGGAAQASPAPSRRRNLRRPGSGR